jgi:8-oxo-dGTP pyrophosphatase MutT (NUDIX family)
MSARPAALARVASHEFIRAIERSLREKPGREAIAEEPVRRAAILLLFRAGSDGEPELLLIKRAEFEGDPWSGHIACPGGRMEPGDHDLAGTAIRETWEETAIDVARDGEILGALDDLVPRTPSLPAMLIRPFVAIVRSDTEIILSPEVADASWVPVTRLHDPENWTVGSVQVRGINRRERTFRVGDYVVWGLTERALRDVMERSRTE